LYSGRPSFRFRIIWWHLVRHWPIGLLWLLSEVSIALPMNGRLSLTLIHRVNNHKGACIVASSTISVFVKFLFVARFSSPLHELRMAALQRLLTGSSTESEHHSMFDVFFFAGVCSRSSREAWPVCCSMLGSRVRCPPVPMSH